MSDEASTLKKDRKLEPKGVLKSAFSMASGTLTSRILGLCRDMALAALFERSITDAWTAAFRLPNLFRRLLGEGSLAVSFIPVFLEARQTSAERAQNLLNTLYTVFLIFFGSLTVLGILYMENVLGWVLSAEYLKDPEKWLLTVRLARIMFGFVYFICSYAYFMGILNALGNFGLPAVAPALLNISMLVFTVLPTSWFPQKGDGLAWGVLLGGVLQSGLLWWALRAKGYLPRLNKHIFKSFYNEDVKKILINMLPGLLGLGLFQFTTLVNLHFASAMGEGAISYIYWADRLLELPLSLVSVSLGAALLPTLSALVLQKNKTKFSEVVQEHFLFSFFLAWPATVGLFFLAEPIIEVLFKRGHFSVLDAKNTAMVLQVYSVSLLFFSGVRILAPAFYAVRNIWLPALSSLGALLLHMAWASWWIHRAGLQGLVLSSMIAVALQFLVMLVALQVLLMKLRWRKIILEFSKIFIAGLFLAGAVQIYLPLAKVFETMPLGQGLALGLAILAGGAAYFGGAFLLHLKQVQFLFSKSK